MKLIYVKKSPTEVIRAGKDVRFITFCFEDTWSTVEFISRNQTIKFNSTKATLYTAICAYLPPAVKLSIFSEIKEDFIEPSFDSMDAGIIFQGGDKCHNWVYKIRCEREFMGDREVCVPDSNDSYLLPLDSPTLPDGHLTIGGVQGTEQEMFTLYSFLIKKLLTPSFFGVIKAKDLLLS